MADTFGLHFVPATNWYWLDRHAITFKKTALASEQQQRPNVRRRRKAGFDAQPDLAPERRVFIDEAGASTKMARLYGRAVKGEQCRAPVAHGHWSEVRTPYVRVNTEYDVHWSAAPV